MAEELAHHGYPISSGTLYPLLHRMETADASKPGRPIDTGLARRLGTADAMVIGLGSIIGVFATFAPAAAAAGTGLLIGLAIAGFVAYCNATSSAALAATYPTSGGTYLYGRDRLGPWWGFTAGWGFGPHSGSAGRGDHRGVRLNRPAAPLLTHAPPRCGLCPGTQDSSRVMSRNQGRATPQ